MERLQIALEKARETRRKAQDAERAGAAAAEEAAEDELPLEAPAAPASDATPWSALPEMSLRPKLLRQNRVMTFESSPASLPFDQLRTRIVQQLRREGGRRIAIVSSGAGVGKTTLCANLAFCFGRQPDIRTLVIDFDLRRPALARTLGQKVRGTMADVISGTAGFADHALRHGDNLAFGLNRAGVRNTSEILQSRKAADFLAGLEETYAPDFVLFDLPPLLATDDTMGFLRQVDAALIVAEAERTPIEQIDATEAQVAELTKVLGVVLNRCSYNARERKDYGY